MEIIIFALSCIAAVAAVAIGAYAISAKIMKGPKQSQEIVSREAVSEWSGLTRKHDPEKGRQAAASSSEAYQDLMRIYKDLSENLPGSMHLRIRLQDEAAFRNYDVDTDFAPFIDMDERKQYLSWAAARHDRWSELRDEIDRACASGAMSDEPSRSMCMELADKIYDMLSTDLTLDLEAPADDGVHTLKGVQHVLWQKLSALAGEGAHRDGPDIMARYQILKDAGFRCVLCGRSPVSGGVLQAAKDPVTGRMVCLCGGCAGDS